ncbi:Isochorismatase-like protein [Coniella lustricola]|uniref:Isochorismatase-like protein n=1 Tax=Coniella lustricola TaxID=2025994 RepID=A0A2T3AE94_9PEZI|nr:Isochorismatase-like protein [Coniella lustricola]
MICGVSSLRTLKGIINISSRTKPISYRPTFFPIIVDTPRSRVSYSDMATASATRQRLDNSAIFICDLQDKFRPAIHEFDKVVLTTQKILRAAAALNIPTYFTTQNAARLGPIVPELQPHLSDPNCRVSNADKTLFSMWLPELVGALPSSSSSSPSTNSSATSTLEKPTIILLGIESHICITQTTLDALRAKHKVYLLADAISSCNKEEVPLALARLRSEGAVVTTSESWLYEVVGDASTPEFKKLIGIVKDFMGGTREALQGLAPVVSSSKI